MATVDDRVVQLEFNNKQFEAATAASMATLDKLKKSLDFSASRTGVDDLDKAFSNFKMGNLGTTIEGASAKFLALATIGITALSNIATKAMQVGAQLVKSLTIDPMKQGFQEYETQLNAVQTILANTQAAGTNLKDVNGALNELNHYADMTIYNFSEMTRNIGTFTAAGVALKPATAAIKGIANLAALSGSNSQQASTAMYQLSQAISAGRVSLMDWNSVVNAGMGGAVFQRALAQTAEKMGTLKDGAVKLVGPMKNVTVAGMSFRESISDPKVGGWLTSDVLTKTLAQFTGDLTDAELAAQGFSKAEIAAIQAQAKTALDAATQVKTFSQLIDTTKEAIGSGWAQTWQYIFGDFAEAKKSWSEASRTINSFVGQIADARNAVFKEWHDLGGRDVAIEALKNAFHALSTVLLPIKEAFRQIFPAKTGQDLYNLTVQIKNFFANIALGTETMDRLKRIFAGIFAVIDIVKQVLGGFFRVFVDLAQSVNEGSGGFLELVARIGDFLVKIDQAIKNGDKLTNFFNNLTFVLMRVIGFFSAIGDAILAVFDGKNEIINQTGDALGRVADRLSPFGSLLSTLNAAWQRFVDVLQKLSPLFATILQKVGEIFSTLPQIIQQSVQSGDYSALLDTINTAIFGGIALMIRKFIKSGGPDISGGVLKSIAGSFNELTNTLKAMQQQIKAEVLMKIAIAVGILVASVVALSLIPSAKLTTALAGLAGVFTELMLAMKVLDKIGSSSGFIRLPVVASSLILLSTAILILTGAVAILSTMGWDELAKGLSALTTILLTLDVTTAPLAANSVKLVAASAALILLATALNIIAGAMKIFATLSWEGMAKGMVGIVGSLTAISVAMNLMPGPMMLVTAAGLVLVASAVSILAGAMKVFASISWENIGKGLVAILGSLAAIAVAMNLMPGPMMIVTAAGLVLVAVALNGIAGAMKIMSSMSWEEVAKGLTALAGSMAILAAGLYLMTGTLMGSSALVVAAGALMIMAPAMKILGSLSWEAIGKGLITLAGAFAVIGLAGLLLTPVIPQIIGLAAAVALLGAGIALLGVGVLAFATAITMLVAVGSMGVLALTAILQTVIGVIPTVMVALQLAIVAFADAIIAATPKVVEAIVVVLVALMNAIIKLTPKIVQTLGVLLDGLIKLLVSYIPKLVVAGVQIVTGILTGLAKEMPKMLAAGADLIIAYIKGIGAQSLRIIKAAGDTLITFLTGLTRWIRDNTRRLNDAGVDLIDAIIDGMISGIGSLGGLVINKIKNLGGSILDGIKGVFGISSPSKEFALIMKYNMLGMVKGIEDNSNVVDLAAYKAGKSAMDTMKDAFSGLSDAIDTNIDLQPTIAPILDLTEFRKDASAIGDILGPKTVQPTVSTQSAVATNTAIEATKAALEALAAQQQPSNVYNYTQNNNSPKALSTGEIYRQTRNQLSILKGATG